MEDITDVYLFDAHALVQIGKTRLVSVLYKNFQEADDVPENYIIDLLDDNSSGNEVTIEAL